MESLVIFNSKIFFYKVPDIRLKLKKYEAITIRFVDARVFFTQL
jgi:hypothetical protein